MSNSKQVAGLYADQGRVADFVDGIYGQNRRSNRAALKKAAEIALVSYVVSKARRK